MSAADRFRAGEWRRLYAFVEQRGGAIPCREFRSYLRKHATLSAALLALPAASETESEVYADSAWCFFRKLSGRVNARLPDYPGHEGRFSPEDVAALVAIARATVEKMAGES